MTTKTAELLNLQYRFTLQGNKIARLEIAP